MAEDADVPGGNPGLVQALIPLVCLFALLTLAVQVFGDGATSGPVQVALMCAGFCGGLVGLRNNVSWSELENAVSSLCSMVMVPVLLLLSIGGLIAVWIASGVIPSLIVYGAGLLHPSFFCAAALVICAVVSLASGSAWTTQRHWAWRWSGSHKRRGSRCLSQPVPSFPVSISATSYRRCPTPRTSHRAWRAPTYSYISDTSSRPRFPHS